MFSDYYDINFHNLFHETNIKATSLKFSDLGENYYLKTVYFEET
jgi:hypothetical protein